MEKGYTINVLDHGYVRYIDHLGTDKRIVEAARISYKSPSKGDEQDRKLLHYLYKSKHSSPFEMVKVTLNIKLPIFVMRQYIRHRMQNCLSGDNYLYFDVPNALKRKNKHGTPMRASYKYKISSFYNRFHSSLRNQYPLSNMCLRFYNEDTKTIESTNVTDIWIAGNKDVYELELENGYKIKSTLDHKFFTSDGYLSLKDAIDLRLNERKEPTTWINNKLFYCNGILAYRDKDLLQSLMDQGLTQSEIGEKLNISYHTIRKWMRIYDIKYSKEIIGSISSRKQKGRKKGKLNRILTDDQRNKMRQARLGSKCNFWKDGISKFNIKNRTNNIRYNNWKYNLIQKLIRDGKFKCCITNEPNDLVLHHIIPVWKDSTKYMDDTNVIPIREDLHKKLHALNLETIFEDYVVSNKPLQNFFEENGAMVAPKEKTDAYSKNRNRDSKITIKGYKIKNITYIGTETVYDLTVNNPFHNFVCNGIVVHNCNEMSARYTELPGDFYIPDKWRRQDNTNKQGSIETEDSNPVVYSSSDGSNIRATDAVRSFCKQSYDLYQLLLKQGIAREMARIVLPVNVYTEIYACWDMRNLLHFISLRDDSHAQAEMQEYGKAIKQICVQLFPWTMEAYEKYKWVLK